MSIPAAFSSLQNSGFETGEFRKDSGKYNCFGDKEVFKVAGG